MDSTSWHKYPKLYALGHRAIADIFLEEVIVEEKVDGSQFSFGSFNGELKCRSKSISQDPNGPDKLFSNACEIIKILHANKQLVDGWTYSGEYLKSPKHNTLAYDRTPKNLIVIFDIRIGHEQYLSPEDRAAEAERIGFEAVPILFRGKVDNLTEMRETLLDRVSFLGGSKIEGFVVKNHKRFAVDGSALMGKFVSEAFKEVHEGDWKERNPKSKDALQLLCDAYQSEARWRKAIQHLKESGKLAKEPKDIGPLMKEVQQDILEECVDEIKEKLFKWAWPHISRSSIRGLPEFYKKALMDGDV